MSTVELLEQAVAQVQTNLGQIKPSQWDAPTPCDQWDVRALVQHLVGGSRMSTTLLNGGTKEDALACFTGEVLGADPVADFAAAAAIEISNMRAAALDTMVDHPAMQMPAGQMLNFRVSDYVIHSWDLARAIGIDETLNPSLVTAVWDALQPMVPMIPHVGVFGPGASGTVVADAPLQTRLLDLLGRRP